MSSAREGSEIVILPALSGGCHEELALPLRKPATNWPRETFTTEAAPAPVDHR